MKPLSLILTIILLTGCANVRPWTRGEKILLGASVLASYADYQTTSNLLDSGGHENNPLIGKYPSKEKLGIFMISSQVIVTIIAHYFPKYRKALLGTKTAVNTGCSIHNSNE